MEGFFNDYFLFQGQAEKNMQLTAAYDDIQKKLELADDRANEASTGINTFSVW